MGYFFKAILLLSSPASEQELLISGCADYRTHKMCCIQFLFKVLFIKAAIVLAINAKLSQGTKK